jgi:pimeloyl-ACP methyl ester carboxylesterase
VSPPGYPVLRGVSVRFPVGADVYQAAAAGAGFVLIDLVDGPIDETALAAAALLVRAAGAELWVRTDDQHVADRSLRLGAHRVVGRLSGPAVEPDRLAVVGDPALVPPAEYAALDLREVQRTALARWQSGAGSERPPLVLLPGQLGDVSVWDEVAAGLMPDTSCLALRIDLDDSVAGMAASVLAAAPDRFSLAGHSLGGVVALQICRTAPERVARVALLNCSGRAASAEQIDAWGALLRRLDADDFEAVVDDLADVNLQPGGPDSDGRREHWRRMGRRVGVDGLRRQLQAQITRPDQLPALSTIGVPALVLSGELDAVCRPKLQRELAAGLPHATAVTLPGAGHMTPLEQPAELAAVLREWLES